MLPKFKKKLERETDINFVSWIAEIGGLNPCARVVPHKKQLADYRAFCSICWGTKLIYSKPGRHFQVFKNTKKHTFFFFIYFPKIDSYDNKNSKFKL